MRIPPSNAAIGAIWILIAGLLAGAGSGIPSGSKCDDDVNLQITTDRTSYRPGAMMRVTFLVTNTAETPLYLFRRIGQCTNQHGWLSVELRDLHNQEVEHWGCSVDDFSMNTLDIVSFLSDYKSGVFLQQGEIYGKQQDYDLPKKKGTFRVHAELAAAGYLTEEQKQALSQHHMRVLRNTCVAPSVTITLK